VIVDLQKFLRQEQPYWEELQATLQRLENDAFARLNIDQLQRLYYLYQRAAADLASLGTFAAEPASQKYLEALVARAYGELHATRQRSHRLRPWPWLLSTWPQTFRQHCGAFWLSLGLTLLGALFGSTALLADPQAKAVLMPFSHLQGSPSERVHAEEQAQADRLQGGKATFSAWLMTHNIRVSIFVFALGMTWGLGTSIVLFYNGIILGAVMADYMRAGEAVFLAGWLLPHGAVEIPAILLAGQAGFILARALLGWGSPQPMRTRLRHTAPQVITLMAGVALLLVWAGFVEAFLSQYHEPAIPYAAKIALGVLELALLGGFLSLAGKRRQTKPSF
jgi:uncharacterized membrane protein SpoIIM required for sporulation